MFWFVFDSFTHIHLGFDFPKALLECNFSLPRAVISLMCWRWGPLFQKRLVGEDISGHVHADLCLQGACSTEDTCRPDPHDWKPEGSKRQPLLGKHTLSSRQLRKRRVYLASIPEVTAAYFKSYYQTVTCCPHPRIGFLIKSQCAVTPPHVVTRLLWRMCSASGSFAEVSNLEGTRFPLLEGGDFKENSERLVSFLFSPRLTSILSSLTPYTFPCIPRLSVIIFMIFKRSLLLDAKVFLNHLRFKGKNENHWKFISH